MRAHLHFDFGKYVTITRQKGLTLFFLMLCTKGTRNRASPARIVKLYSEMTPEQRTLVQNVGFGGLLSIGCPTLPADITRWLVKNFDTQESQLIISG